MRLTNNFLALLILLFIISGCGSKDEEMEKIKQENEKLKREMLEKDQVKLKEEVAALQDELESKKKMEYENSRMKNVHVTITVDKLKDEYSKWDVTGGPDIKGYLTFNDFTLNIDGEVDKYIAEGYLSDITLKKGDKIKVYLYDKDFSSDDKICVEEFAYNGMNSMEKSFEKAKIELQIQ